MSVRSLAVTLKACRSSADLALVGVRSVRAAPGQVSVGTQATRLDARRRRGLCGEAAKRGAPYGREPLSGGDPCGVTSRLKRARDERKIARRSANLRANGEVAY